MKKILIVTVFALPVFIMSCGQNDEQIAAAKKLHDDSITKIEKTPPTPQQIVADSVKLKQYQQQLDAKNAELAEDNNELVSIKEPHDDRTQAEENEQVTMKTSEMREIQNTINDLKSKISALKIKISNAAATTAGK